MVHRGKGEAQYLSIARPVRERGTRFQVLGVVILGFGVWELMVSETIFNGGQLYKIDYVIHFLSAVTIITGFFLFIISFTGCIGALRENICLLKFLSIGWSPSPDHSDLSVTEMTSEPNVLILRRFAAGSPDYP
ncbi:hypothetical protein C0Q70_09029 [Pomacea canaliculata]|uniref:Uncharacterized protein n=1 Tax=Pomacea canaliculata TaxID=400727 RepID=A0A2T7P8M8_POMCA|nr:hypothetical protein C0Q70_09029 [Pomacea canaliculata]